MSFADYMILLAVAAAVFFAVRWVYRRRKNGGSCCGGCTGCSGCCSACSKDCVVRKKDEK